MSSTDDRLDICVKLMERFPRGLSLRTLMRSTAIYGNLSDLRRFDEVSTTSTFSRFS